jgi:protein-export membrane protein SecD
MKVLRAAALMIALTMAAGSAGAQGLLNQLMGLPDGPKREESACKRLATALEMRSAGNWNALDVVHDQVPVRADLTEAAFQRLGGTRLVMQVDVATLRKDMLERAREDIRRIVREERLGSPGAVVIRGDEVEFRPRAGMDMAVVSKAFDPLTLGSVPLLVRREVDDQRTANGVVAFAVPDRAVEERRISSRQIAMEKIERRLQIYGFDSVLIQALDSGRILVVVPGFTRSDQMPELHQSIAKLTLRIAGRFANPCVPAGTLPAESEVLMETATKAVALVEKRVIAGGENLAGVAVVRDSRTGLPAVALRLDRPGSERLAKATQNNIEQGLAFVLDNEIVAMPTIREPIAHGAVVVSGSLTLEQARHLAVLLRAGWVPPPLIVIEQQVVQPKPQ